MNESEDDPLGEKSLRDRRYRVVHDVVTRSGEPHENAQRDGALDRRATHNDAGPEHSECESEQKFADKDARHGDFRPPDRSHPGSVGAFQNDLVDEVVRARNDDKGSD